MALKIVPTKGNLIAVKKSLDLARTGYGLLDKKRNVLIKEMMSLLDEVKLIRNEITDAYDTAYQALEQANISTGLITNIVSQTPIDYGLNVHYRSVMGVEIPKIAYEKTDMHMAYSSQRSNSKVDYAFSCFFHVKELTIKLAEVENSVYRLANAIRKTQMRANALENISIPKFEEVVKTISDALEEKEREEFSRQKVIKSRK